MRLGGKLFLSALTIFFSASAVLADPQVYFSPQGGCQQAVISEISKSTQFIDIAMYYLTSRRIARALIEAKRRHVQIRVVLDKSQEYEKHSKSRYLLKNGIDIRFHLGAGLMHNKFAIIDGNRLVTGSFNWTATAENLNEENLLIIDNEALVKEYEKRFQHLIENSREAEMKKAIKG